LNAKHHEKRRRKGITEKLPETSPKKKGSSKALPENIASLFIYLFQMTESIVRNITNKKQEALKSLSKKLPKKKKKWKHCRKHHQVY
jgi:hypothetical protein